MVRTWGKQHESVAPPSLASTVQAAVGVMVLGTVSWHTLGSLAPTEHFTKFEQHHLLYCWSCPCPSSDGGLKHQAETQTALLNVTVCSHGVHSHRISQDAVGGQRVHSISFCMLTVLNPPDPDEAGLHRGSRLDLCCGVIKTASWLRMTLQWFRRVLSVAAEAQLCYILFFHTFIQLRNAGRPLDSEWGETENERGGALTLGIIAAGENSSNWYRSGPPASSTTLMPASGDSWGEKSSI